MGTVLVVLAILVCVLLGLIILVQNPKGGGLTSGFSGTNNIMGVQRTGDFLEKGTWALAIALLVISLIINVSMPTNGGGNQDATEIQKQIQKPNAPSQFGPIPKAQPPLDSTKK